MAFAGLLSAVTISAGVFTWVSSRGNAYCAPGDIVSSFQLPPETAARTARISQGLAFDGTNLIYVDIYQRNESYNINPTIYKLTTAGSIVSSYEAPESGKAYHKGLAWDGSYIWVSVAGEKKIYKVGDPEFAPITTENDYPYGLKYYDGNLYEIDGDTGDVFIIDPDEGITIGTFSGPSVTDEKYFGLTTDGSYLYIGTYGRNDRIYKYTLAGSQVSSFAAPGSQPLGLAYDGTYLWWVDDNTEYFYQFEK